jgi:hypothetical protein
MALRHFFNGGLRIPRYAVAAAILSTLLFASRPVAAEAATLTLTPDPPQLYDQVWPTGCGYIVGKPAIIAVYGPDGILSYDVGVDASGCLYPSHWGTTSPGDYTVDVRQNVKGKRLTSMASCSFDVY